MRLFRKAGVPVRTTPRTALLSSSLNAGRDLICDRLADEVGWIRQCANWLTHLHTSEHPRRSTCALTAITPTERW